MFLTYNSIVEGSNVIQFVTSVTEKIDLFGIIIGNWSYQSSSIAKVLCYTYTGFVFDNIATLS